jgi:DNA repair exonuclease SbcCD ATPase subunit
MTTKDKMLEKAEGRLKQIDAEIDRMLAQAAATEAEARLAMEREIAAVEEKRTAFRNKVSELKAATDDASDDLREGFERAWASLSDALGRTAVRFR